MGSRLEFETLISDLSSRFINLPADEVDGAIEDALRGVCEVLDVDLCGAVAVVADGPRTSSRHPTPPRQDAAASHAAMQRRSSSPGSGRRCWPAAWSSRLRWRSSRRRPPSTASTCRLYGVKSNLTVPLSVGGDLARRRSRVQHHAGGARLAGRGGEAAATGRSGLRQCARSQARRRGLAGERGAPEPRGGLRGRGALGPRLRDEGLLGHRRGPARSSGSRRTRPSPWSASRPSSTPTTGVSSGRPSSGRARGRGPRHRRLPDRPAGRAASAGSRLAGDPASRPPASPIG